MKYALLENSGTITLGFRRRDGEVDLTFQGDGVRIDATSPTRAGSGMGTRFVDAFVRQIGGTLARATGSSSTTVTVRLTASVLAE